MVSQSCRECVTIRVTMLDLIESIIAQHPNGIGISAIEAELQNRQGTFLPQRRTLQRRLQKLVDDQRLVTEGGGFMRIYKTAPPSRPAVVELYVLVSVDGAAIRDQVRQALMVRRPVGYQRTFLDNYTPNVTFYLPESLRLQLHEMGRTPTGTAGIAGNRPAGTYAREIFGRLLVDLSWASSKLEGNTYTRLDTQNLIEFGQIAHGKDAIETQMILNHKAAIEMLIEDVNKQVSRIGANIPLIQHNLCPLSFIDVPENAYIEGILGVYELNRIELLRDVFVWAYERSCQRYLAITQTMVEPDPLKIRYREALIQSVQAVVKGLIQPNSLVLEKLAQEYIQESDKAPFVEMLTTALAQLHEGNLARYRLRRSEYGAWLQMQCD